MLYYFFFPEKDQLWTNNYKMTNAVCNNPKTSELMNFFLKSTEKEIYNKSKYIADLYSDKNTEILFFYFSYLSKKKLCARYGK